MSKLLLAVACTEAQSHASRVRIRLSALNSEGDLCVGRVQRLPNEILFLEAYW